MLKSHHRLIIFSAIGIWLWFPLSGQSLAFRSLGMDQGMRTLTSWHCTFDGFGYLWVSTSDGLVRYNGNEINYYYTQTHPGLPSDPTGYLFCDSKNNVWICTPKGLAKANANRQLERQEIWPDDPNRPVNFCIEDSRGYITVFSNGACFQQESPDRSWMSQMWLDSIIKGERIRDIRRFDKDSYLFIMPNRGVSVINLIKEKEVAFFPLKYVSHAGRLDNDHIVISQSGPFSWYVASFEAPDSLVQAKRPNFFIQGDSKTEIEHMTIASNGRLYLATDGSGLVEYDFGSETYKQYTHDAANPFSICENSLRSIISDSLGNIAFTSLSGVSMTNVRPKDIEYINFFKTISGDVFDDRVISIAEDTSQQLWIVMESGVVIISPDGKENKTLKFQEQSPKPDSAPTFAYAAADSFGRIWVAARRQGIGIFNPDGMLVKFLSSSTLPGYGNAIENIRIMQTATDGFMYCGAENGLFRIREVDFEIDTFPNDSALRPLRKARIVDILPTEDDLWVSTSPSGAAWHYDFGKKVMKKYTMANGLLSDRVYGLARDKQGSVYIGTYAGLTILHPDGTMDSLSKGKGLPSTRIDAIECAQDGSIWITNTYNLLQYDPNTKQVIKAPGNSGFSRVNYQIVSSTVLSSGRLVFGAHKGMVIVDPFITDVRMDPLQVFVFYKNASGHEFLCASDQPIHLKSNEHLLRFSFGINDLLLADKMVYRYKLSKGNEGGWSDPSYLPKVDFNLNSGHYVLEVEASDGSTWFKASGSFQVIIDFPWWRKWWVIAIGAIIIVLSFWFYFSGRIAKYKKELSIVRQISDLESKALRAQMNPHFVFNSLNAIQECIVTGKIEEAYSYLSQFSRLLRLVLEHSDVNGVSLHEELEVLSLFVSLEKLRFRNDMKFVKEIDDRLDQEEITISPMLIQPHLENAIWHGLRNKEGEKVLKLKMFEDKPGYLTVVVEDNGIGREKSAVLRDNRIGGHKHKSKGKQLSGKRMELLKSHYPHAAMTITDLRNVNGDASGTQVLLVIPILEKGTKAKPQI